jgi:hypothetical protein
MISRLEKWIKYGYIAAYITAAVIALVTAFLIYCYVHPCR